MIAYIVIFIDNIIANYYESQIYYLTCCSVLFLARITCIINKIYNDNCFKNFKKELYTDAPVLWLVPESNRKVPLEGFYECPVYKTLTRAGYLHFII